MMVADRREEGAVLTHRTALERKRQLKNSLCKKKKSLSFPFFFYCHLHQYCCRLMFETAFNSKAEFFQVLD